MDYNDNIMKALRYKVLNSTGVERDFLQLVRDGDIGRAIVMMQDRDTEAELAIREYDPHSHAVKRCPNKFRKGKEPYITEKLPRGRQKYINEVELFFLLGQPVVWEAVSEGTDEAFQAFREFFRDTRFDSTMREAKRLAGAETECAKVYHLYQEGGEAKVKVKVISRSKGYRLRPLFDQWDNLVAFGYGYTLLEGGRSVGHFDIETPEFTYRCRRSGNGWDVTAAVNPTGKRTSSSPSCAT